MTTKEEIISSREKLRKEYGSLFDEISAILFDVDPIGINYDSNRDEYDGEAGTIIPRLHTCHSVEDANNVIYEEFIRWFSKETVGNKEKYQIIAEKVWNIWANRQLPK